MWVVWLLFLVLIAAAGSGFTLLGAYFLRRWLVDPATSLWAPKLPGNEAETATAEMPRPPLNRA